jgi:16S rRNA (cytosine1402-N4)-methyltransferase
MATTIGLTPWPHPILLASMNRLPSVHVAVLADDIIHWLNPKPGAIVVDGTLGGGGHTRLLAAKVGPRGRVVALDRDPVAILRASALPIPPAEPTQADYRDLRAVLDSLGIDAVDGVLLDLGLSSDQLADTDRGFSFAADGELDLRFDPTTGDPAWKLIERMSEKRLADLIFEFGEERRSRRIARNIVAERRKQPVRSATQLAEIIRRCVPRSKNHRIHPATRTFQALRIAVNDELGALRQVLSDAPRCLHPGGRLAIISFHSLEDRLVKHAFRDDDRYMILTKKPIRPNQVEQDGNVRSRSARLRVAQRIPA